MRVSNVENENSIYLLVHCSKYMGNHCCPEFVTQDIYLIFRKK